MAQLSPPILHIMKDEKTENYQSLIEAQIVNFADIEDFARAVSRSIQIGTSSTQELFPSAFLWSRQRILHPLTVATSFVELELFADEETRKEPIELLCSLPLSFFTY